MAKPEEIYTHFFRAILQLTLMVTTTGITLAVMIAQHQIQYMTTGFTHLRCVGPDTDGTGNWICAGCLQVFLSLYLHQADPADTDDTEIIVMAECRNLETNHAGGVQDGSAIGNGYFFTVDHDINIRFTGGINLLPQVGCWNTGSFEF
jgi:hypothetical protein